MGSSKALLGYLLALTLVGLALAGRGGRSRCKYEKAEWSECDPDTNTMSRTQTLKRGPQTCEANRTDTKTCGEDKCKYKKGPWSECDADTNMKSRTLTLKRGDSAVCEESKPDERPCGETDDNNNRCKYKKGDWSECDETTHMKSRTLTLKRGQPSECEATKSVNKPCNKGDKRKRGSKSGRRGGKDKMYSCHYAVANRTECDVATNTRTMTLTLKRGLPSICDSPKTISKPCNGAKGSKNGCRYGNPQVTDCVDDQQTMTKTLIHGDATCEATKSKTKKCGAGRGGGRGGGGKGGRGGGRKNKNGNHRQRNQEEQ